MTMGAVFAHMYRRGAIRQTRAVAGPSSTRRQVLVEEPKDALGVSSAAKPVPSKPHNVWDSYGLGVRSMASEATSLASLMSPTLI